jgi:hypothetical protein
MDLRLAQRLSKHERYQFLDLEGKAKPRPNQIRNYVALKEREKRYSPESRTVGLFIDGRLDATSSNRANGLDFLAKKALDRGATVLVARMGAGKRIRLFIDEEEMDDGAESR